MKPVTKRLKKSIEQLHAAKREAIGTCADPLPSSACGCMNGLAMWRGPKGEKGDQGPKGDKGDNAGSFLTGAEFVVNPEGQEPGSYLRLELIDVDQQEIVVYVDLSELEDVYAAGQGIDITNNIVSAELNPSNHVLTLGANGLGAEVYLSTGSSGTNLVLTGADGTVLSTVPFTGDGIVITRTNDGGLKFTTTPGKIYSIAGVDPNELPSGESIDDYSFPYLTESDIDSLERGGTAFIIAPSCWGYDPVG